MKKHTVLFLFIFMIASINACKYSEETNHDYTYSGVTSIKSESVNDIVDATSLTTTSLPADDNLNRHYEDDVLSIDLPEGTYCEGFPSGNIVSCFAHLDEETQNQIRKTTVWKDSYSDEITKEEFEKGIEELCNAPNNFLTISTDAKMFMGEKMKNAEDGYKKCCDYYKSTGYIESDEVIKGGIGSYTIMIDGVNAYVVWHLSMQDDEMNVPLYEIYVDSPKGNIVHIVYSFYSDTFENYNKKALSAIVFKR